tara:strand:+ start:883 stop:2004 length:1122 start_codon:yes stop_codon:yes gene_type:complete
MIKILHIAKYHDGRFGGIEHISNLINKNFSKNYDITTLGFGQKKQIRNEIGNRLILCKPIFTISSQPFSIKYIKEILSLSKKNDFIYLHYPNVLAFFSLLFLKKQKIIIHWHSDIIKQKIIYLFIRWIEKSILKKSSLVIVTSSNYLKASKPLKKFHQKISIVNFGMKDPYKNKIFKIKSLPTERNIKTKKINIMSIGRLVGYKGYEYLINSMKYLDKERFQLTIIGEGKLQKKLNNLCKINSLENNIQILSNVDNRKKHALFKNCHIFCLPSISRAEAFGLVLLEALSYGIPLITFYMPESGTNFINRNGFNGLLVRGKNSKELANKIIKISTEKKIYTKLSKNARIDYEKRFKEENFINSMSKIFSKVIKK